MVLWKNAFEKIDAELESTKRKRQTLEELLGSGRISQSTYDCLCKDLDEEISQVETRRKALAEKMTSKLGELEEQLQTLEFFLANSEMAYTVGEINDELHTKESSALNLGLDATKQELNWIKEVITQLVPQEGALTTPIPTTVETVDATPIETTVENAPEVATAPPLETPVEVTPVTEETAIETPSQVIEETTTETPFRSEGENLPTQEEPKEEEQN